jgi:hypothetical protein
VLRVACDNPVEELYKEGSKNSNSPLGDKYKKWVKDFTHA